MKCACVWSRGGRGVFNDAVCVFITGALLLPACAEARPLPPKKHACAFFPDSRPHVSERKKARAGRTHGRGEARAPDGAGGGGRRRRAARHGEPVRRLRRAAHRAEHGRLLERHRQDAAHLPLRRVRRVPLRARVQAPARGPGGEARADGRRRGGAHQAAAVRGRAARRRDVHGADRRAARGAGRPVRVVRARRRARRRERHLHGIARQGGRRRVRRRLGAGALPGVPALLQRPGRCRARRADACGGGQCPRAAPQPPARGAAGGV